MRFTYVLLPLTLLLLSLTSGCHHRHCCWGGCSSCCSPCGSCCGYTPPVESTMPPIAVPTNATVVPHMPMVGSR